jgi:hypothetical protein
VADASGVFAPIYLDPTLPSYRVKFTTSADVLIYQVDNVPSNQGVQQAVTLQSTNPYVTLYDTDGTTNQRKYKVYASGNVFKVSMLNDAESVETALITVTGGVVDLPSTLTIGTNAIAGGSYTGTLTGFATPPTGTIYYAKVGAIVSLFYPNAGSGFSGTSNSTSMTITGMPATIRPTRTQTVRCPAVGDNSLSIGDGEEILAQIDTSGVITFLINGSTTGFTASGVKGTGSGGTITYLTN